MHGVAEFVTAAVGELGRIEQGGQGLRDVAIGAAKAFAHARDQRRRRLVGEPELRQLAADKARRGRVAAQPVQRLVHLGQTARLQGLAEQLLGAKVMPRRVELEQALAQVQRLLLRAQLGCVRPQIDADAGEHARQLLHVALAVATGLAQRVQFHQLARKVFVQVAGGVLLVVQVAQHRRVPHHGAEQMAKTPQRMRAQRLVFVIAHQCAQIALVLVDVEVVEPEPGHLRLDLVRRIQRAQHMARGGFAGQLIQRLLIGLARSLAGIVFLDGVSLAAALFQAQHQRGEGLAAELQRIHLALRRRRQGRRLGMQLLRQVGTQRQRSRSLHLAGRRAPAQPAHPPVSLRAHGCIAAGRWIGRSFGRRRAARKQPGCCQGRLDELAARGGRWRERV